MFPPDLVKSDNKYYEIKYNQSSYTAAIQVITWILERSVSLEDYSLLGNVAASVSRYVHKYRRNLLHPTTLKIEPAGVSEPWVHMNQTKRRQCSVDRSVHYHKRETLTSQDII